LQWNVESIPDFEKEYSGPMPVPEAIIPSNDTSADASQPAGDEASPDDHDHDDPDLQSILNQDPDPQSTNSSESEADAHAPSPPISPIKPTRTKSNPVVSQTEVQSGSDDGGAALNDGTAKDVDEAWSELSWLQVTCGWGGDLAGPGRETE
jgi:hypothetical protein